MASTKKNQVNIKQSTFLKWEINALGRLKMIFQRPYISKSSGGVCSRAPLAARGFGARDCSPPPINLTLLRHWFSNLSHTSSLFLYPAFGVQRWNAQGALDWDIRFSILKSGFQICNRTRNPKTDFNAGIMLRYFFLDFHCYRSIGKSEKGRFKNCPY